MISFVFNKYYFIRTLCSMVRSYVVVVFLVSLIYKICLELVGLKSSKIYNNNKYQ